MRGTRAATTVVGMTGAVVTAGRVGRAAGLARVLAAADRAGVDLAGRAATAAGRGGRGVALATVTVIAVRRPGRPGRALSREHPPKAWRGILRRRRRGRAVTGAGIAVAGGIVGVALVAAATVETTAGRVPSR